MALAAVLLLVLLAAPAIEPHAQYTSSDLDSQLSSDLSDALAALSACILLLQVLYLWRAFWHCFLLHDWIGALKLLALTLFLPALLLLLPNL